MEHNEFNQALASYVSFSLKVKPPFTFQGFYDDEGTYIKSKESISFDDSDLLSVKEFSSVEELMDKYKRLKKFLPHSKNLDELKITSTVDMPLPENADPSANYIKVRINAKQLEIAKNVSSITNEIYDLYKREEYQLAKKAYNNLQDYLAKERSEFIGEFKSTREVEDALGMYAVGAYNDSTNHPTVGEGCFVFIEIFIM